MKAIEVSAGPIFVVFERFSMLSEVITALDEDIPCLSLENNPHEFRMIAVRIKILLIC
jgi:hypothetical protein